MNKSNNHLVHILFLIYLKRNIQLDDSLTNENNILLIFGLKETTTLIKFNKSKNKFIDAHLTACFFSQPLDWLLLQTLLHQFYLESLLLS